MKRLICLLILVLLYCHITCTVAMEEERQYAPSQAMLDKFKSFCDIIQRRDIVCDLTPSNIMNGRNFSLGDSYTICKYLRSGGRYKYGWNYDPKNALKFQIECVIKLPQGNCKKHWSFSLKDNTDYAIKDNIILNFFMKGWFCYETWTDKLDSNTYDNILNGHKQWKTSKIQAFAENVLTILKHETDRLVLLPGEALEPSLKVGALILTSERFRSEKALLIAYIEFLKLKCNPSKGRLEKMFFGIQPALIFSAKDGGQKAIAKQLDQELLKTLCAAFADLGKYPEIVEAKDANDFFDNMLWDIRKVHELYHEYPNERYLSFTFNSDPNFWCKKIEPVGVPLKLHPERLYIENNYVTRCDDGKELYFLADIKEGGCRICNESYPFEESIIQRKGESFRLRCKNFPNCKALQKRAINNSRSTERRPTASLSKRTKPNIINKQTHTRKSQHDN